MKVSNVKAKVAAKVAAAKGKVAAKCGKAAGKAGKACVAMLACLVLGCSTAEAPTAQRSQNVTVTDNVITLNIGQVDPAVTNRTMVVPSLHFEIGSAAQANDTKGTETMSTTTTQTPTNDVKTDLKFTYGLQSDTASGTSWLQSLTDASLKGLASWFKGSKADGTMAVTKEDGSVETITCKNGSCYTSAGDCITCRDVD